MKIPHTIPQVILRAYAKNLDEEALKKQYEGRLLRSEDATWDANVRPTLPELCLDIVISEYVFFVKFIENLNKTRLVKHEEAKAKWEQEVEEHRKKKELYERHMQQFEFNQAIQGPPEIDDDDDEEATKKRSIINFLKSDKMLDEFPEFKPHDGVLDMLSDVDRMTALEELDFDTIPLDIAVSTIPDELYWKRAGSDRWPYADSCNHGDSWRRLYMERHLWDAIESFHPLDGNLAELNEAIDLVGKEVIHLHLGNLIPCCFGTPRKAAVHHRLEADELLTGEEDDGFDPDVIVQNDTAAEEEDFTESELEAVRAAKAARQDSSHVDMGLILPKLSHLNKLSLVYEMAEIGLDFEPRFAKFTDTDCLNLANAIAQTPTIQIFELNRSHVTGEQCKTLVREGLIKLPKLKILNLNYNRIKNEGALAVARLLTDETASAHNTLHTVLLARNWIKNKGGKAIAFALTKNTYMTHLDLRLNFMGDAAGRDMGHALVKNKSLLSLNVAANRLTSASCPVIGKMLQHNETLRELNLSSNELTKKGGEWIAIGMRGNKTLLRVDLRLCSVGADFEYDVGSHLKKNRTRVNYSLIERDDIYPPQSQSAVKLTEEEDDEEEEEEEEMEENIPPPEEITANDMESSASSALVTLKKPPKLMFTPMSSGSAG